MPNTPENHPQLPGLETSPPEEFDSAKAAEQIAAASVGHQDAIAERYEETARRFDGVLPESDSNEEEGDVDVAQGAGSSAVAEVVSIDHIAENPTKEELERARGRHPTAGTGKKTVPEMIRETRERLKSRPSHEEIARLRREEELRAFVRRPKDPNRLDGLPKPPTPPNKTEK